MYGNAFGGRVAAGDFANRIDESLAMVRTGAPYQGAVNVKEDEGQSSILNMMTVK